MLGKEIMIVNIAICPGKATPFILQENNKCIGDLFNNLSLKGISKSRFFVVSNGRKVTEKTTLEDGKTYHFIPRLPGGKGGFGSMLRAIGAQIEKTTSREACRDLSGRRMRDINNEKKLKEWLAKEAEREREREERRQERLARQGQSQHKFEDAQYHEQRAKVQEDLVDALKKGLKRSHNKEDQPGSSAAKKGKITASSKAEWLGVDIDSDDMESSDSDNEANPGDPESSQYSTSAAVPGHTNLQTPEDTDENSRNSNRSSASLSPQITSATGEDSSSNSPIEEENKKDETVQPDLRRNKGTEVDRNSENSSEKTMRSGETEGKPLSLLSSLPPPSSNASKSERDDDVPPDTPVDLDSFSSSDELAMLGLERLKNALMSRGLKCGGTLEERAERLFSIKGFTQDQIDPALFAKSKGKGKKSK